MKNILWLPLIFLSGLSLGAHAQAPVRPSAGIERMRVLWIGAHPDDEVNKFIAWLARGRNVETAYMSLTRGDGGQNLIGNELGEALGVVRTEELLAARRIDGAHQYFGREYDFGFSKSAEETLRHWPRDSVLGDIVTVVRAFRPHIVVTTFSGTPRDGHGQHQVSALLGREAYQLAADTVRFPISRFGSPWLPLKLYRYGPFGGGTGTVAINVGEYVRSLGLSSSELASDSRSQHKSQGEGQLRRKGVQWLTLERLDSRVRTSSPDGHEKSMFEGIDTVRVVVADGRIAPPDTFPVVALEAVAQRRTVALGDSVRVSMAVFNRGTVPVTLTGPTDNQSHTILPDSSFGWTTFLAGREITQPWWLATPRTGDMFSTPVSRIAEDDRERLHWARASVRFPGAGSDLELRAPIVYHYADSARGDTQVPLTIAPGISLAFEHGTELARAGGQINRRMKLTLRSAFADSVTVTTRLRLPAGLSADSVQRVLRIGPGGTRVLSFDVSGRLASGSHEITAEASANGQTFDTGFVPIEYPHITPQRIYHAARVQVNAVDVRLPARLKVAYIQGSGDNVAPMLEQIGVPVTIVRPEDLPEIDLGMFSAVVIGPRAYQVNEALMENNGYLLGYVRNGGRLVVQYGRSEMLKPGVMPYPIQRRAVPERVTDENAPVRILDSSASLLNTPNRITQKDFDGWVQERATYMPSAFDAHYSAFLEMNDPGEAPNRAAILAASYGRGSYIYVPLAMFRQIPAAVPGAVRIFANLLGGNEIR